MDIKPNKYALLLANFWLLVFWAPIALYATYFEEPDLLKGIYGSQYWRRTALLGCTVLSTFMIIPDKSILEILILWVFYFALFFGSALIQTIDEVGGDLFR